MFCFLVFKDDFQDEAGPPPPPKKTKSKAKSNIKSKQEETKSKESGSLKRKERFVHMWLESTLKVGGFEEAITTLISSIVY